ncbi:hypothetical protein ACEZ3G_05225 [Maribacter algicola]|uniref:Uncharacterized protein n=1 Tax=Meishania litoralis TaxID=3434685 RepID=A0ACC7LGR9_9FLAO
MKKRKFLVTLGIIGFMSTSCSVDDNGLNVANLRADLDELNNITTSGSWRIANFSESDDDHTSDFTGYDFFFEDDGSLFAISQTNNINGRWSLTMDESGEDFSSNDDCGNCTNFQLLDVLTACSDWYVDKLERNDEDLEDSLSGYRFNFSNDGTFSAMKGTTSYQGSWESSGTGNDITVLITISDIPEIEETWRLHEIELENGESKVDLRIGDDRLRFKNNCSRLDLANTNSGQNEVDFNIFFESPVNFNRLSQDWEIISYTSSKIELVHVSGGNGGTDLLTFEKN